MSVLIFISIYFPLKFEDEENFRNLFVRYISLGRGPNRNHQFILNQAQISKNNQRTVRFSKRLICVTALQRGLLSILQIKYSCLKNVIAIPNNYFLEPDPGRLVYELETQFTKGEVQYSCKKRMKLLCLDKTWLYMIPISIASSCIRRRTRCYKG